MLSENNLEKIQEPRQCPASTASLADRDSETPSLRFLLVFT